MSLFHLCTWALRITRVDWGRLGGVEGVVLEHLETEVEAETC